MADLTPTDDNTVAFDSRDQAAALMLKLIAKASQEICFFGPTIDPVLFDNEAVIEQLSEFARRSPRTQIRLVVFDTQKNVSQNHRLLPLAQRLSSKIHIHIASKPYQETRQMFMLIDTKACLYCPNHSRYQGLAEFNAPARVRDLKQNFDEIWAHSTQDINTRRLHL
jgi:hypothetical protein